MSSPGGVEVGRVSVRVVPDTSKFLKQAKRELEALAKQLKVKIEVELDASKISEQMKAAKQKADGQKAELDVEVDGDGVARETRRLRQLAQKLVGAIKMTVGLNIPGSLARVKADMKVIQKVVQGYNIRIPFEIVGISKWLGILGAVSAVLLTIPHLIGAIGGAVNVVGGALALLPALAGAAAFGIGALVVGMQGFFDALSNAGDSAKFEESLKNLTPAAQEAARALAEFREPLSEIRKSVQENLFKGMADPLRDLKSLLPPIKTGLEGAASGIREMGKAWIEMATSQKSVEDAGTIADNSNKMFEALRPALANFGQALRDIAVVGSTFLPQLGTAVSNVTSKFAAWATEARESGRLEQIIQNMIDKTKQLGRIIADVVVGFQNIFRAMTGGQEFLDIVEGVTQGFRDWSEAKDTQATLARLANVMRTVADAAKELFGQAFRSAGQILKDLEPFLLTFARTVGAVVAGAIRAITPPLQAMARWLSKNRAIMVPLIITIIAMVTAFKLVVTAANAIIALKNSILALKAASGIIGTVTSGVVTNLKKMITQIVATTKAWITAAAQWVFAWAQVAAAAIAQAAKTAAAWVASALKSAAFTARYYAIMAGQAILQFGRMAVAAATNALKIVVTWTVNLVRLVAITIAQMATVVAVWVANWIRMAAVALAQAARIAIAWLIAMGPIAIIIAAIIALVVVIVLNWDKIASFLEGIWNWIKDLAATVWNAIADFFVGLWDTITSAISTAWNAIGRFFSNLWNDITSGLGDAASAVWDWVTSLPGKIWDAIKSAASTIFDIGKWIIQGIVNGLKNAASAIWNFIKGICEDVWNGIKDFFGIGSPSRLMMKLGKWINQGWVIGLKRNASTVSEQAQAISGSVYDAFSGLGDIGTNWADSITSSTPEALASVRKLMDATSAEASAQWTGQIKADELEPMEDRVLAALATGLRVELDGKNVTKSVNQNNRMNDRRR